MNYGFNDEKEKVPMYSRTEAFDSTYSPISPPELPDWVIHGLFDDVLKIITNRIDIEGVPYEGVPPTEIPALQTIAGRIRLPETFTSHYTSAESIQDHITVSILPHYDLTADGRVNVEFTGVSEAGGYYYLMFALNNRNNVAVPFPLVDLIIIAISGGAGPGPGPGPGPQV